MSLAKYHQKRSFSKTPEPEGKVKRTGGALRFVVQQHHASHLHYDFRLEMEGVLKSWAVPKGPSMDPEVKRLAMMVEDHPYEYRSFEGTIPEGNYGAGTVIVWDEGTYEPADDAGSDKKAQQKSLLHQLYQGRLKFVLHGHKLKGSFALVKASARGENAWLLMKLKDKYASSKDITLKNKSVQSNRTLEQVAKDPQHTWVSDRKKTVSKKAAADAAIEAAAPSPEITEIISKGTKAAFPSNIKPMLAMRADKPFDHANWLYEIKWDGYRAIGYVRKNKVELLSRKNISYTQKFTPVTEALQSMNLNAVLDGEIVALDEKGKPDFQALQGYLKQGAQARLLYAVFDLLWYNGKDYTSLPLIERKTLLQAILPQNEVVQFSDHVLQKGTAFFKAALKKGLEGVMAKECNSSYAINHRSSSWLKIKNEQFTEAIICGYTKPRNSRKHFGAVVLGKYEGNQLVYIGHSGSGIDDANLQLLYDRFQALVTKECPFAVVPKTNMPVTWLKPQLVCEVKYTEWTEGKNLRHPIFMGLRDDKVASEEKNEKLVKVDDKLKEKKPIAAKRSKTAVAAKTQPRKTAKAQPAKTTKPAKRTQPQLPDGFIDAGVKQTTVTLNKHPIKLTNLDKLYWPDEGISKRDMLNYYAAIMPYLLPYMKNRPQSLNRFPDGIKGPHFYQKDVGGKVADWITTFPYVSESDGDEKQFLVCTDEASLLYIATLGCIEMNPWHSRIQSPDRPDWCVIDLDPDGNSYDQVVEAALAVKRVLDAFHIPGYPKTSGATGMHIYIPLGAKYDYEQSRLLAHLLVTLAYDQIADFTSLERSPAKRKGKIYLDFLQNRSIQTIAAPYSLRPKPGATVSTPLDWSEVKKGLLPTQFTIYNILDRIRETGDLFKPVLGKGIALNKVLKAVQAESNERLFA